MCSFKPSSLLYSYSQAQLFTEFLEQSEVGLQAKIKLEESSEQKYKIKLNNGFIGLYSVCVSEEKLLSCLPLDFNLKMSKIYKQNGILIKNETYIQGIRLENSRDQSVSFYFNSSNQAQLWIKKLSFYVNQLHFQRLFKPVRKLGEGASAAVYQFRRLDDGKKFAVKVFCKEKVQKASQMLQVLKREAEILRTISCEDVIKFEGVFQNDKSYFFVMEMAKGKNVYDFLLLQKTKLQKEQIRLIMRNLIKNLQALQQLDIIHRDIKLENIIIDCISLKTKVIDYGLAVFAQEQNYIHYSCGTPGYLSPQIVNNNKNKITTKSDIFSAGIVFHILLTGVFLFPAKNAKQMLLSNMKMKFDLSLLKSKDIDPSAFDLLQKMLVLNPEHRLSASQCLMHQFLKEEASEDDQKPSTPSTEGDYENYQF